MKKIIAILFAVCGFISLVFAQDAKFSVSVSSDSILLGNYVKVTFSLKNAKGDNFQSPEFEGFQIVSGPNMSSNFSMINGEVSQSVSYTYYIEPKNIGNHFIQPASIETENHVLETLPIEVMVVPNPDGIIQNPEETEDRFNKFDPFQDFPSFEKTPPTTPKKKKKKRKTYRI